MDKKLVVVLGMHRSGSSAITRGLQTLGVDLGHSFIPNYDDNVKGFWEDADFQAINVEMLSALGHEWHSLSIFTDGDLPSKLSSFRLKALNLLRRKTSSSSVLGVKDPRFARLMPFWKELFDSEKMDVGYVVPLRNPISVALSLKKRNGFEFEKSFFLWQQHMLLSLLSVRSESAIVVDFDLMLMNPEEQLFRISQKLSLHSPVREALRDYSDGYLDSSLRHAEYTFADLQSEPAVPAGVRELFRILSLLAEDRLTLQDNGFGNLLIEQLQELRQINSLFQLIDRNDRATQEKEQKYSELEKNLAWRVDDIQKQSAALSQFRETVNRQKTSIEDYKERLVQQKNIFASRVEQYQEAINEKNECLSQTVAEYSGYKAQQRNKFSDQQRMLVLRQREIDRLRGDIKQKSARLDALNDKLSSVFGQLDVLECKYNRAVSTPEWKIGTQLRLFARVSSKFLEPLQLIQIRRRLGVSPTILKLVQGSGVFDEDWYGKSFPTGQRPDNPLQHYLSLGWKEGRTPSILFDGNWYLKYYPDVKMAGVCPLRHYLEQGWKENRQPHPAFDSAWYLHFYQDIQPANISPLQHYLRFGAKEGRRPNRNFDVEWFTSQYAGEIPFLESRGALVSYLLANQQGENVVEHNPLFQSAEYAVKNPEFDSQKMSALAHLLPRAQAYIQETVLQSAFDEGISNHFDQKAALAFCLSVRRAEFTGDNVVNDPLVSIVMPTRNRYNKICSAIDSVLQQSYGNWELLIVDDGSDDGTCQLVDDTYSDPRISIQVIEPSGVCRARNTALASAKGELIAYLDSDNIWTVEFLEVMVAYLQQRNADFVYSAIRMHNEGGTSYRYREFNYTDLLIKNYVDLNAILHKRQLYDSLGGFDESLSRMVDWDLVIRYTASTKVESAPFIGVDYDNHNKQTDRITVKEPKSWRYAIMNKHMIDWDELNSKNYLRDQGLVSVIIPVYGQLNLTRGCIESLFSVSVNRSFEVILVDNGSDYDVLEELFMWSEGRSNITLVRNLENFNFALGCNLGFVHSKGANVVFLNNDTEVTEGWLDALLAPLKGSVGAVQPKLIYPDGRIQCAGIVFSDRSSIGFPVYADFPSSLPVVNKSRKYQAITAACMAVSSADFIQLKGFDPLFVNGQEDVDFCLRLAERGKSCWYESDSVVVHHESRTPSRGKFITQNRLLFNRRWSEKIVPDADNYFQGDGYKIRGWRTDGHKITGYQPVLSRVSEGRNSINALTFAIKVPCPCTGVKNEWGDYHFAHSLGLALRRAGHSFRIDFLNEWSNGSGVAGEVNLVLRGLSVFEPRPEQLNLMWMISHPDKVEADELAKYDHVFVASESYAKHLQKQFGDKISCLLQCTDPSLFYPDERDPEFESDVLFVGNSRNQYREVVKLAIEAECKLSVYGTRWQQFIGPEFIKGDNISNNELGHYYKNASVVLNDHWPDMRDKGFVSNRIFDVLACGVPVVSDQISGLPEDIHEHVLIYGGGYSLSEVIDKAKRETLLDRQNRFKVALDVHRTHSFDARAQQMLRMICREVGEIC